MKGGWFKRYLMIVAIILVVIVAGGVWLKPSAEKMRESVEAGLTEYARAKTAAGETVPAVTHQETNDWIIGVSHGARIGDLSFFCMGGFKVTYCQLPDE